MKDATRGQTWKLFTLTGEDYRNKGLTYEEADRMIQDALGEKQKALDEFQDLYDTAYKAGTDAAKESEIQEVVAVEADIRGNPIAGKSPSAPFPICGFGWVNIKPGNSKFANWLKKNDLARKSYYGGVDIWISDYGQSYDRKVAHASAMARVFSQAGIKAYGTGRLD